MESSDIYNGYFNSGLWLSVSWQMRETLVKAMTGQTIASKQSAKLVSSSLNQVTQVKDEISLEAQVKFGACRICTCMPSMPHLHAYHTCYTLHVQQENNTLFVILFILFFFEMTVCNYFCAGEQPVHEKIDFFFLFDIYTLKRALSIFTAGSKCRYINQSGYLH